MSLPENTDGTLSIEKAVYGGDGLAHRASGEVVLLPFVLPGELVRADHSRPSLTQPGVVAASSGVEVLQPSPERVAPACVHFGVCGGCQYQMASYPAQLAMKAEILRETLTRAGVAEQPPIQQVPSPHPYGYRNRIRTRLRRVEGELRLGYSVRGTNSFLPVTMCPIAAPILPRAAQALLHAAETSRDATRVLEVAEEVEFFCAGDEAQVQVTLLCSGTTKVEGSSFARAMEAMLAGCPELTGAGLMRVDPRSGRTLESLASWGSAGLRYQVGDETYWSTRGGFFQVNRFLLPALVERVCAGRAGSLAWDLFAGVGLFSRVLARNFGAVTAVEANPTAAADLSRALAKAGPRHRTVQTTTLEFLRRAIVERERPELIVLDPPRAGAGEEACRLLARLAPAEIVYLSCDPTTLARDLAVLTAAGYKLSELHGIDLFPQTYHLETLAVLRRRMGD